MGWRIIRLGGEKEEGISEVWNGTSLQGHPLGICTQNSAKNNLGTCNFKGCCHCHTSHAEVQGVLPLCIGRVLIEIHRPINRSSRVPLF
jgi:hypothetical protein